MKSANLLLYAILGVLGYVVLAKLKTPTGGPGTVTTGTGGSLPAGATQNPVVSVASAVQSIFDSIGKFAQTSPKTT